MKKYLTLTLFAVAVCCNGVAQCNFAIPSNAVVVDSTVLINGGFDPVWVCKGDTLFTGGGFHNIYLEGGSILSVSGGIDTIFVKNTATLLMTGGIHYIYYENPNDLNLNGGIPTLDSCSFIVFDYANAPLNGCFPAPVAGFSSSDTLFCENQCISFTDLSYNNPVSWQWYFPGATPDTSTAQHPVNICYSAYGSYDVSLVVCNGTGCDSIFLTGFISEYPNPPQPVITVSGDTLHSTPAYSYQWIDSLNPTVVLSTDSLFVPAQAGTYQVLACDSSGCCSISDGVNVIGVGIQEAINGTIEVFNISPNPGDGTFFIHPLDKASRLLSVSVFNSRGELLLFDETGHSPSPLQISLNRPPAGIYQVRIATTQGVYHLKAVFTR